MPTRKRIEDAVELIKDALGADFIVQRRGANDQPGRSELTGDEPPLIAGQPNAVFAEWTEDYAAARERDSGRAAFADLLRDCPSRELRPDTRSEFERLLDEVDEHGKSPTRERDRGGREL
jgi:hypothetical protein